MTSFTQEEVTSATEIVRNFSSELKSLTSGKKEKIVIVRNNRFEAVIIPIEEYERMSEAVKILEKIYKRTKSNGS